MTLIVVHHCLPANATSRESDVMIEIESVILEREIGGTDLGHREIRGVEGGMTEIGTGGVGEMSESETLGIRETAEEVGGEGTIEMRIEAVGGETIGVGEETGIEVSILYRSQKAWCWLFGGSLTFSKVVDVRAETSHTRDLGLETGMLGEIPEAGVQDGREKGMSRGILNLRKRRC
jgi:hypothetical protein